MRRFLRAGNILRILVIALLGGAAGGAWYWYQERDRVLSQKPEQRAEQPRIQPEESKLGLQAGIRYVTLEGLLSRLTSEPYSDSGSDSWEHQTQVKTKGLPSCHFEGIKLYCKETWVIADGPKISVGYRYDYTVRRDGAITVRQNDDRVRITVPISASGNAGLRGDGAKILKLHKKNFEGSLTAFLDVSFNVDAKWCPTATVTISHEWRTEARIEVIDNVYVNLASQADKLLDYLKQDAQQKLNELLDCNKLRGRIAPHWRSYSFPLSLPHGQEAYLNVAPKDASFAGMKAEADRISVAARLAVDAAVAATPTKAAPLSLPELRQAVGDGGIVTIALPVSATFEQLMQGARTELLGKTFSFDVGGRPGSVRFQEVEIFPSGDRVAVGLRFAADIPGKLFSVSGIVYAAARPKVSSDGLVVSLADVQFGRILDNDLWNALSVLFEGEITDLLTQNTRFDLRAQASDFGALLVSTLQDPAVIPGLKLQAQSPKLTVGTIYVEATQITAIVRIETQVQAEVLGSIIQ